ncbi:MAG: hypothetical protein WB791_00425 [Waddliaceae bacterium]
MESTTCTSLLPSFPDRCSLWEYLQTETLPFLNRKRLGVSRAIEEHAEPVFTGLVRAVLCFSSPNIFAAGYIIGLIWPKELDKSIEKINSLLSTPQKAGITLLAATVAMLSMPYLSSVPSFFFGGTLGAKIWKKAVNLNVTKYHDVHEQQHRSTITAVVATVAKVLFFGFIGREMYRALPAVFALGMSVGFFRHQEMDESIKKISLAWRWTTQHWSRIASTAVMSILCLPAISIAASFFFSGYLGSWAFKKLEMEEATPFSTLMCVGGGGTFQKFFGYEIG